MNTKALPPPSEVQPHAPDPNVPQLLQLEGALKPYTPPVPTNNMQQDSNVPNFDLMAIVSEFEGADDDQLMLAATQIESTSTLTKTTIMKKNCPKLPPAPTQTFTNCSFGNIGTLNIHIHKH